MKNGFNEGKESYEVDTRLTLMLSFYKTVGYNTYNMLSNHHHHFLFRIFLLGSHKWH